MAQFIEVTPSHGSPRVINKILIKDIAVSPVAGTIIKFIDPNEPTITVLENFFALKRLLLE